MIEQMATRLSLSLAGAGDCSATSLEITSSVEKPATSLAGPACI